MKNYDATSESTEFEEISRIVGATTPHALDQDLLYAAVHIALGIVLRCLQQAVEELPAIGLVFGPIGGVKAIQQRLQQGYGLGH